MGFIEFLFEWIKCSPTQGERRWHFKAFSAYLTCLSKFRLCVLPPQRLRARENRLVFDPDSNMGKSGHPSQNIATHVSPSKFHCRQLRKLNVASWCVAMTAMELLTSFDAYSITKARAAISGDHFLAMNRIN